MQSFLRLINVFSESITKTLFPFSEQELLPLLNTGIGLRPNQVSDDANKSLIDEIMKDGVLWGVPKNRRSVEMRLHRKFGDPKWGFPAYKMIVPKDNLIICDTCGHYHESQTLCNHCYQKVKEETQRIKESIESQVKKDIIDKELALVYKNDDRESESLKGKRIVEIDRERPSWFASNLLSRGGTKEPKWTESNVIIAEKQPRIKE